MSTTPSTPRRTNAAYTKGMQLKLVENVNDDFPRGVLVKIYKVSSANTTGATDPLTSENALYSVNRMISRRVTSIVGNLIRSDKIPHKYLRLSRTDTSEPYRMLAVTFSRYLSVLHTVNCLRGRTTQKPTSVKTSRINYLGRT